MALLPALRSSSRGSKASAGVVATLPIKVHKLPNFEHMILPGPTTGRSKDSPTAVSLKKGLSGLVGSFKGPLNGFAAFSKTVSDHVFPILTGLDPLTRGITLDVMHFVLSSETQRQQLLSFDTLSQFRGKQ